jgi:Rho GTPase-activating protein 1
MHEISLRSSTNLMDAHNLTIVLCPNLVSGSSPAKDIIMCALPGGPVLHPGLPATATPPSHGRTSLGMVIKLCIQCYYEIFDEIQDRSEALPPARSFTEDDVASSDSSSPRAMAQHLSNGQQRLSALSRGSSNRDSRGFDDDESIDDTMLVMSVDSVPGAPPSAWGSSNPGPGTSRARARSDTSGGSQGFSSARPTHPPSHGAGATGLGQANRARSAISIERVSGTVCTKGSISIGRATMRKARGAAVEAVGVTASGFFAPPSPPTPPKGGESESQDG